LLKTNCTFPLTLINIPKLNVGAILESKDQDINKTTKIMKTKMMVLVAMMISVMMVAQPNERAPQTRGIQQHEQMKSDLGLSETQYARIQDIDKAYSVKHSEIRSDSALSRETRYEKQQSLSVAKEKEIKAVLTAEQNATWEQKKAERREMRKGRYGKSEGSRGRNMKASLSLTADQEKNMNEANKVYREKREALKNNAVFKNLQDEHDAAVKSILTVEQYAQWKDQRKHRPMNKHQGRKQ